MVIQIDLVLAGLEELFDASPTAATRTGVRSGTGRGDQHLGPFAPGSQLCECQPPAGTRPASASARMTVRPWLIRTRRSRPIAKLGLHRDLQIQAEVGVGAVDLVGGDPAGLHAGVEAGGPWYTLHRQGQLRSIEQVALLDGVVKHDAVFVVDDLGLVTELDGLPRRPLAIGRASGSCRLTRRVAASGFRRRAGPSPE